MRWAQIRFGTWSLASRISLPQRHLARAALFSTIPRGTVPIRAPLLSFIKERPSAVRVRRVHSRRDRSRSFGAELPHPTHVPPLPILTTPTVCSTMDRAGLLHPATSHGVRRVSSRRSRADLPRRRKTLRSFSLPGSGRGVTTVPALSPLFRRRVSAVLPRPSASSSALDLRASSTRKSVASQACFHAERPMLPWAFPLNIANPAASSALGGVVSSACIAPVCPPK